jgi:hypothetical protein
MVAVTGEIQLAGQAYGKIATVVTVGFVISLKNNVSHYINHKSNEGLTRGNHIGNISSNFLNFVEECVENFIVLCATVILVEWGDVILFLLREPGIGVGNVANYKKSAGENDIQERRQTVPYEVKALLECMKRIYRV